MNGWAQIAGPRGRWHQVDWDSRTGMAWVPCMGRAYAVPGSRVMDYRWLPHREHRCRRDACQQPVEP